MTNSQSDLAQNDPRRAFRLGLLRGIDVAVGLAALGAGVFALIATPPSILREVQWTPLVYVWASLLILGGFAASLGRLVGIWILETSGIAATGFGTLIYLVVISTAIKDELGVVVAAAIILIALLFMARRYTELRLFLSEPTDKASALERLAIKARARFDTGRSTPKP